MRIAFSGWGSEGVLRPMVALAAECHRAGHALRLDLTPIDGSDFAPLCNRLGVSLRQVPERIDVRLDTVASDAHGAHALPGEVLTDGGGG